MTRPLAGAVWGWPLGALAVLGVAPPVAALDPDRAMSQYVRSEWGAERGFVGGGVHAIAQTPDGYLWIGAERGLLRFDGTAFDVVSDSSPAPLSLAQVLGLVVDAQGNLWIRLPGPNLVRHRVGTFGKALSDLVPREDAFTAMSNSRDGALLLAGLVNGPLKVRGESVQALASSVAMPPRSPVISMTQAEDGTLWMGTRDAGLFALANGRVTAATKGLPDPKINSLLALDGPNVWVGTDGGVVRWNGRELTRDGVPSALSRVPALTMLKDRASNVWIGTAAGLLRVNAKGVSALSERDGDPRPVTALFEDREGNLWTGGDRTIQRLRDSSFTTYSRAEGLPSETNGPVHVDDRGRTWFAPTEGGLYWLKSGQVGAVREAGLDADVVYSIAGGKQGIWVGRQRGGVTHLRFDGDSWTTRTYTRADGLPHDSVFAVHEGGDGTVWAGTLSRGLAALRNGRFHAYTTADRLSSNGVTSIAETPDGTAWFATPSGLVALTRGAWRVYGVRDGLPSDDVYSLLADSKGVLWIGTGDGLAFFGDGRIRQPPGAPGSWQERIFGLAEDRSGWLWMATSTRVLRIRRDALVGGTLRAETREYGLADGLQGLGGAKRHRSVVTDPLGRIWLSMDRGLSVVDPARLSGEAVPALARILALSADGAPIALEEAARIPAGRQRITFSYAGISLSRPERVRFQYILEGFDNGWSEPVAAREAAYTNLGPGSYRFRVRASSAEGAWNGPEAAVGLMIAPAVWQTLWFRVAAAFTAALVVAALYRQRLRRLTQQLNLRFEERLAERTRIAQELHDTLLQGVLSASMQLHVAVDHVPGDFPEGPRLKRALELMGRVIEEGRNAVRGLRSAHSDSDELEQAFGRIVQELAVSEETAFRVTVEGAPRALHPAIHDEVYRIGREAVVNAFRHAGARRVEVEVERGPRHLRVVVRDDGRGMEPEVLRLGRDGHWGLSGMRERSERIGARLKVWSRMGAGTEVELLVPGHVAFEGRSLPRLPEWLSRFRGRRAALREARKRE